MSSERRTLDDLLDELPPGLLDEEKIANTSRATRGSRHAFFDRINAFIDEHGREPNANAPPGTEERSLGLNLTGARRDPTLAQELEDADRHRLLRQRVDESTQESVQRPNSEATASSSADESQNKAPTGAASLDDMLADEAFMGLLDTESDADDVFDMIHVEGIDRTRTAPDEIAERQPCEDFEFFEPLFERMRQRVAERVATVEPFHREGQIEVGDYFYLRGQMCLVDAIEDTDVREAGESVYRVRVVFDNGTEMKPYKHSLGRALLGQKSRGYERGQRILDPDIVADHFNGITHRDQSRGFIYVLRSKRQDAVIREQRDLYKVGLTARTIEDRLKGAERQTTYLEGPVELIAEWEIYGANLRRVERILHAFLAPRRAQFTLIDANGKQYHPREWFNVPFETIKQAAEAIMNGTLMSYRLNASTGELYRADQGQRLDDREV
ncbi:GIY-YIG nuclease family protein [Spiribacter vilamensis]|uniref:T5orf172 domain-containing protein n=1 Tax=Spiribacter vilamensis TaxID=531306 RepID=A0A4Q8D2Z4_9GAMM|nr:GIY-YIG nuclease family protein [Spiribacter vilamensis]RZU99724.1 T5orf172 domain-containing protein [Spiribacter vilamensis]TVO61330.1 GIY-YIG nuclease family protein [Spiribacter vilamensis]